MSRRRRKDSLPQWPWAISGLLSHERVNVFMAASDEDKNSFINLYELRPLYDGLTLLQHIVSNNPRVLELPDKWVEELTKVE